MYWPAVLFKNNLLGSTDSLLYLLLNETAAAKQLGTGVNKHRLLRTEVQCSVLSPLFLFWETTEYSNQPFSFKTKYN